MAVEITLSPESYEQLDGSAIAMAFSIPKKSKCRERPETVFSFGINFSECNISDSFVSAFVPFPQNNYFCNGCQV